MQFSVNLITFVCFFNIFLKITHDSLNLKTLIEQLSKRCYSILFYYFFSFLFDPRQLTYLLFWLLRLSFRHSRLSISYFPSVIGYLYPSTYHRFFKIFRQTDRQADGRRDGWMVNRWMDGRTDWQMDDWWMERDSQLERRRINSAWSSKYSKRFSITSH